MTAKPILFSGPMVRALLAGRKTQTRRVLKSQPPEDLGLVGIYAPKLTAVFGYVTPGNDFKVSLPYAPGDLLWVREALDMGHAAGTPGCLATYKANGSAVDLRSPGAAEWAGKRARNGVPSIHMPRWASRLTLRVTDVRVQRVQEISHEDAIAEGCSGYDWVASSPYIAGPHTDAGELPDEEFRDLWDSLNKPRGYGWNANPWVVAVTFEVIAANVDDPSIHESNRRPGHV